MHDPIALTLRRIIGLTWSLIEDRPNIWRAPTRSRRPQQWQSALNFRLQEFGRPAGSPLPTRSSDVARGLKSSSEQHVRRLEPNEDCAICSDLLSTKPASDLAWCSSGCGKSVHEACFNKSQASCLNSGKTPTCMLSKSVGRWALVLKKARHYFGTDS